MNYTENATDADSNTASRRGVIHSALLYFDEFLDFHLGFDLNADPTVLCS